MLQLSIHLAVFVLLLLILIDITFVIFRLGISGLQKGYMLLVHDIGYRKSTPSIDKFETDRRILVVGDSSAVGPGAVPDETLVGRLANEFNLNVTNLSANGSKTRDIIYQINSVAGQKFSSVIIHAGNMDIRWFTNLKELRKNITTLLDSAKKISNNIIIFRGGNMGSFPIFPLSIGYFLTIRSRRVRKIFKEIAEKKSVIYLEMFMERKDDIFLKNPHMYYYWDMIHLNGVGFKVWFDYFVAEIKRLNIKL